MYCSLKWLLGDHGFGGSERVTVKVKINKNHTIGPTLKGLQWHLPSSVPSRFVSILGTPWPGSISKE